MWTMCRKKFKCYKNLVIAPFQMSQTLRHEWLKQHKEVKKKNNNNKIAKRYGKNSKPENNLCSF